MAGTTMTLTERQKCFEDRKQLEADACKLNHYVTLGVDIDAAMLLTPDSSPSAVSSSSYQNSLNHSTESLVPAVPPSRGTVLNSPRDSEQEHNPYLQPAYNQVGSPQNSIGSPQIQLGSPYSAISSPESQIFSPHNQVLSPYDQMPSPHSQMGLPQNQMGSPHYTSHSPSPYTTNIGSPSQFSGHSSDHISTPPPQYPVHYQHSLEDMDTLHRMAHFTSSCVAMSVYDPMTQEQAIYSTPVLPMSVHETFSVPQQLPPFTQVFENHMAAEQHPHHPPPTEAFCPEPGALPIKQISNEFGIPPIEFYHPPTPPTPEMCPPEMMCGHPLPEMCGPLTPLPPHLCSMPTIPTNNRRRPKPQRKIPQIEVDDSDIKDIPTSSQLWEFTLRVLKKPKYKYMVSWEKREEGLFRFNNAQAFAALWGKHRNRPQMSYDKVARALRYYYKRNILEQVGGRLTYRFTKRLSKMYMSDV